MPIRREQDALTAPRSAKPQAQEANLTAHLPTADYRARVQGLERRGQDYRCFIELSPNSVAGHAQCAKGLDDQPGGASAAEFRSKTVYGEAEQS